MWKASDGGLKWKATIYFVKGWEWDSKRRALTSHMVMQLQEDKDMTQRDAVSNRPHLLLLLYHYPIKKSEKSASCYILHLQSPVRELGPCCRWTMIKKSLLEQSKLSNWCRAQGHKILGQRFIWFHLQQGLSWMTSAYYLSVNGHINFSGILYRIKGSIYGKQWLEPPPTPYLINSFHRQMNKKTAMSIWQISFHFPSNP